MRPKEFFQDCVQFFKENLIHKHLNVHLENERVINPFERPVLELEEEKTNKKDYKFKILKGTEMEKSEKRRHSSIERKNINEENSDEEDSEDDLSMERGKSAEHLEKNERKSITKHKSSIKMHFSQLKQINDLDMEFTKFQNEKPKMEYALYKDPFREKNHIILTKK